MLTQSTTDAIIGMATPTHVGVDAGADAHFKRAPIEVVALPRLRSVRVEGCSTSRVVLAFLFLAAVIAAFVVLVGVVVAPRVRNDWYTTHHRMSTLSQTSWTGCVVAQYRVPCFLW